MNRPALWLLSLATVINVGAAPPGDKTFTSKRADADRTSAKVRLIDAGAQPRHLLRFKLIKGSDTTVKSTMRTIITQTVDQWSLPPDPMPQVEVVVRSVVTDVHPNGDATCEMTYVSANVIDDPNIAPAILKSFKDAFATFAGAKCRIVMTNRGEVLESMVDSPINNAMSRQLMDQINNGILNLTEPLPEEPVGIGARWVTQRKTKHGEIAGQQESVSTLERLEAGTIHIASTSTQSADAQDLNDYPGLAAQGGKARLESLKGTSEAKLQCSLGLGLPIKGSITSTSTQKLKIRMGKEEYTMGTEMKVEVVIEGTVPHEHQTK